MFDSLLAALRVVVPMALLMGLGALIRGAKIIDRPSMAAIDRVIMQVFMPVLLFKTICDTPFSGGFSDSFRLEEVLFGVAGLLVLFLFSLYVPPKLVKDRRQAASMGQAIVYSNYLLFSIAVGESIYGKGSAGPMALLGTITIPVSNALAVALLERSRSGKASPGRLFLAVLKNPMTVAALLGVAVTALRIPIPDLLHGVIKDVSGITTPLCFVSLGVSLDLGETAANRRPLTLGVLLRMVLVPLVFLPLSVALGFRGPALCALMVLFAAPAAVTSYPMAVTMDADGPLAGQLVCGTTLLSIFTLFCFTFLFKSLGML